MTMMTMMMGLGGRQRLGGRQCLQTFGHSWKLQLQAKESRNVGQEVQSCTMPADSLRAKENTLSCTPINETNTHRQ